MPSGADAIVMVEDTQTDQDRVTVLGPARTGYIRRRAENLAKGQEALPAGATLTSAALALAGTMGHGQVEVVKRPKIAILSTGDELVPPNGIGTRPDIRVELPRSRVARRVDGLPGHEARIRG